MCELCEVFLSVRMCVSGSVCISVCVCVCLCVCVCVRTRSDVEEEDSFIIFTPVGFYEVAVAAVRARGVCVRRGSARERQTHSVVLCAADYDQQSESTPAEADDTEPCISPPSLPIPPRTHTHTHTHILPKHKETNPVPSMF